MSKPTFQRPLVVELLDGKRWRLANSFQYITRVFGAKVSISIKADFETDFASIPKFLWFLPYWAKYSKASIIHDWLYRFKSINGRPITRKEADLVFYEAMLRAWRNHKSGPLVAWLEYTSVRLFGWLAWRKKKEQGWGCGLAS